MQTSLIEIYQFEYQAHFKGIGSEHELCKVYVGSVSSDTQIHPHPEEIQTWDWFEVSEVNEWMTTSPQLFTPWFLMEWKALQTTYQSTLREALRPPEPNPAH